MIVIFFLNSRLMLEADIADTHLGHNKVPTPLPATSF